MPKAIWPLTQNRGLAKTQGEDLEMNSWEGFKNSNIFWGFAKLDTHQDVCITKRPQKWVFDCPGGPEQAVSEG